MNDSKQSRKPSKVGKPKVDRPPKPYPDFPLTPHNAGVWCKSINGKIHYFGRWGKRVQGKLVRIEGDGVQEALDLYNEQRDDLYAGRAPRINRDGLTIAGLCNQFLTFKKSRVTTGELTLRSFQDYKHTTDRIVRVFGQSTAVESLNGTDFERLRSDIAKTRGPVALTTEIIRIRVVFNFAFKHDLLEKPTRFGAGFDPPSRKTIRKARNSNGSKMFEASELRKIIENAPSATMRAMILLAANSGMGNNDIGQLPFSAVNLDTGWIDFPREKTGTSRRFPLWSETVVAIKASIAERPKPKPGHEQFVFLTRKRQSWSKDNTGGTLSCEFRKLLKATDLYRLGLGFYCLRRTFQTVAEEAGETATRYIMGHADESMSARYRQRISDERLQTVVDHIREWLFDETKNPLNSGG